MIGGKEVAARKRCDACVEKDKQAVLAADRMQGEYTTRLAVHDRETQLREWLEATGVNPWEHGNSTLDNFDPSEATFKPVERAKQFVDAVRDAGPYDPVRGLYLWGETGCGKTHIAVGVARHLIENNFPAKRIIFDQAAELIARIQDTYGRKEESTMAVLEKRFHAGLWILDDFGTERASDDVTRHLTLIFARRAMRPTLITSNISPEQLDRERPELMRVLSRLGPKYFSTVEVKGSDRRFD